MISAEADGAVRAHPESTGSEAGGTLPGARGDAAAGGRLPHLHADAVAVLEAWHAPSSDQEVLRRRYLGLLERPAEEALLKGGPVHLTASTLVVSADGADVLLTLHRKAQRWLQTGGHCEPSDATLAAAALREAVEESGVPGLRLLPGPVALDAHELVGAFGTCREHLDVRFVAVAPLDAVHEMSEESLDLRWFPVETVPDEPGESLAALARTAQALVCAEG